MASSKARRYGQPGGSARSAHQTQRAHLSTLSWKSRAAWLATVAALGAVIAGSAGFSPLTGALVAATGVAAVTAIIAAPHWAALVGILAVYWPISFVQGAWFTSAASGYGDYVGGSSSLMVAAFVSTWAAVKYSRGRAWVTLAVALGASIVAGGLLLSIAPGLGLNAARLTLAMALLLRCGGWAWIAGAAGLAWDSLRTSFSRDRGPIRDTQVSVDDAIEGSQWLLRAGAEQRTAEMLTALPAGFTVFHDIRLKGVPSALAHLVVGPSGVFVLASVPVNGPVTESGAAGVNVPGVPIGAVCSALMDQRREISRVLKVKTADIATVVVAHGIDGYQLPADTRRTLAVFAPHGGTLPAGNVTFLAAEQLTSEINTGLDMWSALSCRTVQRRARMKLSSASVPVPTSTPAEPMWVAGVSADGHIDASGRDTAGWLHDGLVVDAATSAGFLTGLRVAGVPYLDRAGNLVVDVCLVEEWEAAETARRSAQLFPYPVAALSPAE